MIKPQFKTISIISENDTSWQRALKQSIRTVEDLVKLLNLKQNEIPHLNSHTNPFPLLVPKSFVDRMEKGNPNDPLLKQILPVLEENNLPKQFIPDPLSEKQANPLVGLLHKYRSRVLILLATGCPIHCRYCFRRHFPYHQNRLSESAFKEILSYIEKHTEITEVILSGGEPLLVKDSILKNYLQKLATIQHLKIVRIHSRLPILIPERITSGLIEALKSTHLKPILVVHCNHPNELNETVRVAVSKLIQNEILVLNQAVLLKGINDSAKILTDLSYALFQASILPYYVHLPDKVESTAHFFVSLKKAKSLFTQLQQNLPGFLLPKFVKEQPGKGAKTQIMS